MEVRMETVIVTGLGCISPLGDNVPEFWNGLVSGMSGISPISGFSRDNLRNSSAGEIRLKPEQLAYARDRGIRSRLMLFADLAIAEALRESGLTVGDLRSRKVGLVIGISLGMSLVREGVDSVCENADAGCET